MNTITIDIGNSGTKVSLAPQSPLMQVDLGDLKSLKKSLNVTSEPHHWVIVSVAPAKTETLTSPFFLNGDFLCVPIRLLTNFWWLHHMKPGGLCLPTPNAGRKGRVRNQKMAAC